MALHWNLKLGYPHVTSIAYAFHQVPLEAADQEEIPREDLAPVIMRGHWRLDQRQRSLFARLR